MKQMCNNINKNDSYTQEYDDDNEDNIYRNKEHINCNGNNYGNTNEFKYYNQKPVYPAKYTDSDNSEDEGIEDYKLNGYHPVHVGEILLERYIIMQKLGWGHFSTAWLAKDTKFNTYVAIKIQKSAPQYIDAAYDEVEILQELEKHNYDKEWVESVKDYWKDMPNKIANGVERDHSQIVQLLNSFIYNGLNGKHFCMVFEIMGVTLLEIIKRYNYKGIPLPYIRIITKQILIGLDFLHRMCNIIHTDLKPENILVCLTKEEMAEIMETGTFSINKINKKNEGIPQHTFKTTIPNNTNHNNAMENHINCNESNGFEKKNTKKQLKKKLQKFKAKHRKRLEKQGLSPDEIESKLNEIMQRKNDQMTMPTTASTTINIDAYDINSLIERPRIASLPKLNNDTEDNDDSNMDLDFDNSYSNGFNIEEYSQILQMYLKERTRVMTDVDYRYKLLYKQRLLSEAKDDNEKNQILKRLLFEDSYRGPKLDSGIKVKICDMGNACWYSHHFSTHIQTRQYRSPEVIIGIYYNETTDLWSLACIIYELLTGDFLFEPHKGQTYSKDDNHLAQFMGILGKMPKQYALGGKHSNKYFDKKGNLRRIPNIPYLSLKNLLMRKNKIKEHEAQALSDFLLPMLEYYPEKRASARDMLQHPWLKMEDNYDYLMSDWEVERMNLIENYKMNDTMREPDEIIIEKEHAAVDKSEGENDWADSEDNSDEFFEENHDESDDDGDQNPDMITMNNFNNSFAQYGQLIDLAILDKGNPQFNNI